MAIADVVKIYSLSGIVLSKELYVTHAVKIEVRTDASKFFLLTFTHDMV